MSRTDFSHVVSREERQRLQERELWYHLLHFEVQCSERPPTPTPGPTKTHRQGCERLSDVLLNVLSWTCEMAQLVVALAAKASDRSSIPKTHKVEGEDPLSQAVLHKLSLTHIAYWV